MAGPLAPIVPQALTLRLRKQAQKRRDSRLALSE